MSIDPRLETMAYLEKHNLLRIFDHLGAKLASEKPVDPNAFLISEISQIIAAQKQSQPVTLFKEKDIDALFTVFDITNKGILTTEQYKQALEYVGVRENKFPIPPSIDRKAFVKSLMEEISAVGI